MKYIKYYILSIKMYYDITMVFIRNIGIITKKLFLMEILYFDILCYWNGIYIVF